MGRLTRSEVQVHLFEYDQLSADGTTYVASPWGADPIDISDQVVQGEVDRVMEGVGRWTLVMLDQSRHFEKNLQPGSYIRIQRRNQFQSGFTPMLWGRVDTIRANDITNARGGRRPLLVLEGRDHGGLFQDATLDFNPWITLRYAQSTGVVAPPVTPLVGLANPMQADLLEQLASQSFNGDPVAFINFLLTLLFDQGVCANQVFKLPVSMRHALDAWAANIPLNARGLIDFTTGRYAGSAASPRWNTWGLKGATFDQTVFNVMEWPDLLSVLQRYCNPAVNELFFRLARNTGKPEIVLRERPFPFWTVSNYMNWAANQLTGYGVDSEPWDLLQAVEIGATQVIERNVAKSGATRANYFMLRPSSTMMPVADGTMLISDPLIGAAPVVDLPSIARYGLRRLTMETFYLGLENFTPASSGWLELMAMWIVQVASWYWLNDRYFAGRLSVGSLQDGEVGEKLLLRRAPNTYDEFYIDQVNWSWQVNARGGTSGRTTYGVSRGLLDRRGSYDSSSRLFTAQGGYPLGPPPPDDIQRLITSVFQPGAQTGP